MPEQSGRETQPDQSWSIDTDALNAAALGLLTGDPTSGDDAHDRSAILARNLEAIALRSPRAAKRIGAAQPRFDLVFADTKDGVPTATIPTPSGIVALASKRRPLAEAQTIADSIDLEAHGGIVVLGFALGYHARKVAERAGANAAVIVFEPDLSLLRTVLERVDHSEWIRSSVVCFLTDEDASGEMSEVTRGLEAPLAIGIELIEHAPSRARLGDRAARFGSTFAEVVGAMRTQVITTLMQSDVTLRNLLMNAEHYVSCPGIANLKDAATGRAAVIVAAGPSLERNLHLLADPATRERVVVIAVQTVLRPMLDRGIRPDFVTALDYHEISTRFYEGLTAEDLSGITLVAEPKVNPAVLDAFPGAIRLVSDEVLEQLFGPTRTADDDLPPGATVAHLAYSLARHLGCDPAILIGQDLGFTDGQYYASGAAIHDTWAPELSPFRTLEMFEWERIARGKSKLVKRTDQLGRPIYTDQQMATYLAQFEREFVADLERGRTIIDATEGGVAKRGADPMPLAEALGQFASPSLSPIALPGAASQPRTPSGSLRSVLDAIRTDSRAIARNSRETRKLLSRIAALQSEPDSTQRINALVRQIHTIRDDVESRRAAYALVQRLNQTGTFQRFKSDRLLRLNPPVTELDRQKREVERDALNVGWIAQMADLLDELVGATLDSLDGAPKQTRPRAIRDETLPKQAVREPVIMGVITAGDASPDSLRTTIERAAGIAGLSRIAVLTDQPDLVSRCVAEFPSAIPIEVVPLQSDPVSEAWHRRIARARAWANSSWRGGIAGASCYDQVLRPEPTLALLDRFECDGAMIIGGTWTALDQALSARIIERHAESPEDRPLVFSQASPGHAPCLVSRVGLDRLISMRERASHFATLGGILSYVPAAATPDPIAADICIKIDPALRDASPLGAQELLDLTLEITGSPTCESGGERRGWWCGIEATPSPPMTLDTLRTLLDRAASHAPGPLAVTLASRGGASCKGDPIRHPDFAGILRALQADPRVRFIHLRTDLAGPIDADLLASIASVDVVSIDLLAQTEETYARISGHRCTLQSVLENAQLLHTRFQQDRVEGPLGTRAPAERWLVARLTRCDATYEEIEGFYDHWVSLLGHAVIDPLPCVLTGQRIAPLRTPALAQARATQRLAFDSSGNEI